MEALQEQDYGRAFALKEEGDEHTEQGRFDEALAVYKDSLAAKPDYVEAHSAAIELIARQGLKPDAETFSRPYNAVPLKQAYVQVIHTHQSMGQPLEAIRYGRGLCVLDPKNGENWIALGMLHLGGGQSDEAIEAFKKGLSLDPGNSHYRTYLVNALLVAGVEAFDDELKTWLGRFLREPGKINTSVLIRLWINLLRYDDAFEVVRRGLDHNDFSSFKKWVDGLDDQQGAALASPLMCDALRITLVPDLEIERFLGYVRRRILGYALGKGETPPRWVLPLALSLAENCFLNEYIFDLGDDEKADVAALGERLSDKKALSALRVAAYACYQPLYRHDTVAKTYSGLFSGGKDKALLKSLLKQQVIDPNEERKLAGKIPSLGAISDETSKKVREQYEENPYPRWFSLGEADTENVYAICAGRVTVKNILIAGAGTGRHTIGVGKSNPRAIVAGVDLSLPSLAYAQRKANEQGIWNVKLVHGDLLDVGKLGSNFDVIESVGVLHHMKNPEAGLEALVDVLNSGGMMKLGVYSQTARKAVTECQNYIKEKGYLPTADGIRAFRRDFADMPEDHPFRLFARYDDYYATSMVRDLLFHVQEITFTIPRIKKALADTGLMFLGFCNLDASVYKAYRTMFPEDAEMQDLDNWDKFEQENPKTFIAMYQFWCQNSF